MKYTEVIKINLAVTLFVISLLLLVNNANAATVSPLTFDVTVDPGQVVSNYITIFNTEGTPIGFNVEAEDFTAVGESGGVALAESVPPELSAKNWLTFSPSSFVVESGKSMTVQFTLQVPLDADPGGKYTSVVFSSVPSAGGNGPAIAQKIASLLLIKVTGVVKESLVVKSFESPEFLENGPIDFTLRLENSGTVHLKPAGFVFLKDWRGGEVAKISLPQERVIPKTVRAIDFVWNKKWLFGKYTANFAGIYGSNNEPLSASVSFWVVPWKIVGLVGLVLLVLLGFVLKARSRIGLAFKILFKGQ